MLVPSDRPFLRYILENQPMGCRDARATAALSQTPHVTNLPYLKTDRETSKY